LQGVVLPFKPKDRIDFTAAPHDAYGMALTNCVLANHEIVFRLEVRSLPLFQHLDNVGHFPKLATPAIFLRLPRFVTLFFQIGKSYRRPRTTERLRNAAAGLRIAGTQNRELTATRASGLGCFQGID
jgi:hypothetical protein